MFELDLNQETHFTILVYSTGFRITLPALKLKWNEDTFLHKTQTKTFIAHAQTSKGSFQTHIMSNANPVVNPVPAVSTSKTSRTFNHRSKATMTLQIWQGKFKPTPTLPWRRRSSNFQTSTEIRPRTPLRRLSSWLESTNAKSPTSGMTSRHSPTSGSHSAAKRINGSAPWSGIFNWCWHRKHGLASDRVSRWNSQNFLMTNSSLTASPTYRTGMVKIPNEEENVFLSPGGTHLHTQRAQKLNRRQEVILKIRSRKQLMTTWTTSPILCSLKCSRRRLQKTFADSYHTRIRPDWQWKKRTRYTSLITGSKWTKSPVLSTTSMKMPTTANPTNRTSRLSDRNRGNKIVVFSPTPTAAIIAQGARTTGQTTMATDNYSQNNQPKSNASRNGKFCVYGKIMNHTQE